LAAAVLGALDSRCCLSDPVRHGLATKAEDWPFSTIHRDLRAKVDKTPTLRAVA